MKLENFLEKFDQFTEIPNSVEKIRELVLELAMKGRLVKQISEETPASMLLKTVQAERAGLVANRKIKVRSFIPIKADELPFGLPSVWQWARLSDVGFELGQKIPDKRFTYIDVGSIDADKGQISARVETIEPHNAPSRARKLVKFGTVIYSTVRPYLLNIAIVDRDFDFEIIASTAFGILHPFTGIDNRFLFYWLRSKAFTAYVEDGMKGMAYPAINEEKFYMGYIPVPPSEEQKRIVAKVDELMALCDRLETQLQERDTQKAALARASLARFAEAPTSDNLNLLFHDSYTIEPADLRKTIHNLAVQGKLVPIDANDEPPEVSFPMLAAAKAETDDETFPAHWLRVPLGKIGEWRGGGTPSKARSDYWKGAIPWVSPKDMKALLISDTQDHISESALEESSVRMIPSGSLLMVVRGMILGRAFPVALTTNNVTINQDMKAVIPFAPDTSEFMILALRAFESTILEAVEHSTHGTCKLLTGHLERVEIPLPPLAEQRRIVTKVNQLLFLVDQLEAQLAASRATETSLMNAVVAELTAGA